MTTETVFRVIYVSRNLLPPDEAPAAIDEILAVSRRNNARVGVTGALLFSADCFAQSLEGPIEAVETVFERIQCDERHGDVVILEAGNVAAREFADWSMAYAGRCDDVRASFDRLVGPARDARPGAGSSVREILRGAVQRALPALG